MKGILAAVMLAALALLLVACTPTTPYCDTLNETQLANNTSCIPRPPPTPPPVICNETNSTPPVCPEPTVCPPFNSSMCPILPDPNCPAPVGITFARSHCMVFPNNSTGANITLCISSTNGTEDAFNVEVLFNATNGTGVLQ